MSKFAPGWDNHEKLDKHLETNECPKCQGKLESDLVCPGYQIDGNWMRCWTCDNALEYQCPQCGWKAITTDSGPWPKELPGARAGRSVRVKRIRRSNNGDLSLKLRKPNL